MLGLRPIAIPGSDGVIVALPGYTVVSVIVNNSSVPAADLLIYDNASAGSGNLIAVIPSTGANGIYRIENQCNLGIYVKNVSGWVGTIWISGSAV